MSPNHFDNQVSFFRDEVNGPMVSFFGKAHSFQVPSLLTIVADSVDKSAVLWNVVGLPTSETSSLLEGSYFGCVVTRCWLPGHLCVLHLEQYWAHAPFSLLLLLLLQFPGLVPLPFEMLDHHPSLWKALSIILDSANKAGTQSFILYISD